MPDEEGDNNNGDQHESAHLSDCALHLGVRRACEVPQQTKANTPHQPTSGIESQELQIAHPAETGEPRHDRPQKSCEARKEHRRTATLAEKLLCALDFSLVAAKERPPQHPTSEVLADLVSDRVAQHGRYHHEGQEQAQRQTPLRRQHASENHRGFAGQDKPDEDRCLPEHEKENEASRKRRRHVEQVAQEAGHVPATIRRLDARGTTSAGHAATERTDELARPLAWCCPSRRFPPYGVRMARVVLRVRLVGGDLVDVLINRSDVAEPDELVQEAVEVLANDSGVLRCLHGDREVVLYGRGVAGLEVAPRGAVL